MFEALVVSSVVSWLAMLGLAMSIRRVYDDLRSYMNDVDGRDAHGPILGRISPQMDVLDTTPQGRPTVCWFMAVGCAPCRAALPVVNALAEEYDGFNHVVSCVGREFSVLAFQPQFHDEIVVQADPQRGNAKRWEVHFTPFVVVLDGDRYVRFKLARISHDKMRLALDGIEAQARAEQADSTAPPMVEA